MNSYFVVQMSIALCCAGMSFIMVKWRSGHYLMVAGLIGLTAALWHDGWVWLAVLLLLPVGVAVWLTWKAARDLSRPEEGPVA